MEAMNGEGSRVTGVDETGAASLFFSDLQVRLSRKRLAATQCGRCAFVVLGGGPRYWFDAASNASLREGTIEDADLTLLVNARTLADIRAGTFNLDAPAAHHVFVVAGDAHRLAALQEFFGDEQHNWLSLRLQGAKK